MLRIHQRNFALVILSSVLFLGSAFPAIAALYHADGTAGATPDSGPPLFPESYSLDLGVQAGGGVTFTPNFGIGVHSMADSLADGYGVRSHTYSQLTLPYVVGIWSAGASSTATVPEPTTLVLLMLAATGWCVRRGREHVNKRRFSRSCTGLSPLFWRTHSRARPGRCKIELPMSF